jgi:hypothetical protein
MISVVRVLVIDILTLIAYQNLLAWPKIHRARPPLRYLILCRTRAFIAHEMVIIRISVRFSIYFQCSLQKIDGVLRQRPKRGCNFLVAEPRHLKAGRRTRGSKEDIDSVKWVSDNEHRMPLEAMRTRFC